MSKKRNKTAVVMICKKNSVEQPLDLRPISLCNSLYKIVKKNTGNKMESHLRQTD